MRLFSRGPEPDGSSSAGTGAGAVGWAITGSAAASSGSDSSSSSDGETNCAKKAAAGESLSSADKEASSASPAGSSDPDEAPASQERSAEEPSPSAGASPESTGAGSGGNGSSGPLARPQRERCRAGEASSEATTALAEEAGLEEAGEASSQATDSTRESAGAPHATSPTVPDASVATGRTALITCHRAASGMGPSTGVAIRQPECVRKRCSDHVMTLPPLTDVGPSDPSTTTSKAPRTAMCASPDSSMSATKLGSAARLAAKAEVSSWRRTARSAPSSMSSQNRWASCSLPGSRTTIPRSVTAAG
ncbi:MAG: hypothetical protein ACLRG2_00535 [Pauljensenia sp.]